MTSARAILARQNAEEREDLSVVSLFWTLGSPEPGYDVAGFGGPPKMLAALRLSCFAFSFSA